MAEDVLGVRPDVAATLLHELVEAGELGLESTPDGDLYLPLRARHTVARRSDPPLPQPAPHQRAEAVSVSDPAAASDPDPVLVDLFHREMVNLYERALAEVQYRASGLLSLLSDFGGLRTARQLLAAGSVSTGFTALWERGRLDLTVEALVLDERFQPLFRESERATARYRLAARDYAVGEDGDPAAS